ncbi:hypothetical protein [Streptomyces sp. TLI_105]|uniref:hypothetical protein n=1 Tax=Streptomyces sp. TLI_105 TaxID=1881019 RepID=UPI0015A54A7E
MEKAHWQGLQAAYDLTVNGLHTYYALAGANPVLVHNSGGTGTDMARRLDLKCDRGSSVSPT